MKKVYRVYGRIFRNKREAVEYHKKIYGDTNYQASIVYIYKNGKLTDVQALKK